MTSDIKNMTAGNKKAAMRNPSVAASFAGGLIKLAVTKGASRSELVRRAGLSETTLSDPDARVPFAKYIDLMRAAKELSGDPSLALHYGEVSIHEVSIVGLIGQASESGPETFAQLNRYVPLVVDVDMPAGALRFQIRRERGGLWFVDTRTTLLDFPELTESWAAQFACGPRHLNMPQWVKEVHVSHAAPGHAAEYERVLRAPVVFNAGWNALRIDESLPQRTASILPRYVFGVLTDHADNLLRELENTKSTRGRVENLLLPILHKGDVGMDIIADKMALSRQTLFRKLKAEGTTFEKVLDELRYRLAVDYLRARKVSVHETAYLVGFSDPAAFSRAFKRWTGTSPREVRAAPAN